MTVVALLGIRLAVILAAVDPAVAVLGAAAITACMGAGTALFQQRRNAAKDQGAQTLELYKIALEKIDQLEAKVKAVELAADERVRLAEVAADDERKLRRAAEEEAAKLRLQVVRHTGEIDGLNIQVQVLQGQIKVWQETYQNRGPGQ